MPQPEPAPGSDREGLLREMRELERRVARIEIALRLSLDDAPSAGSLAASGEQPGTSGPRISALETPSVFPLLGRALLGLAGAYLLRAFTEAGALPSTSGVAIGVLYAMLWLVWAARTPAGRGLEAAFHSVTAAMVLSPLLWEATLRFHAVTPGTAGGILLLFTVFGLAVSWRKNLLVVAKIALLAGLGTAAGLLVATHDALPFTFVFLATAAAVEISACLDHWLSERWLAAAAADLSVLLATWLVTNERGLPPAYAPIPPGWLLVAQASLAAIYLSSIIFRTLLRDRTFTGFETAQCALAFLIGVGGGLRLSKEAPTIAAIALACAVACYVVAFARLDQNLARSRNLYTYSTFGLLLALAGSRILFSGLACAGLWAALAIASLWAGGFFGRLTLDVHGGIYLALALGASGALRQAAGFVLGAGIPARIEAPLWAGGAAAAVCYVLSMRRAASRDGRTPWICRLTVAGAAAWLAAGMLAYALTTGYHAVFGLEASHAYCATLRTAVLVGGALLLAWAGSRWRNRELSYLIHPMMALGAYRLLMEDLHQDRKAALFLSLLIYGAALIVLPRLSRPRAAC